MQQMPSSDIHAMGGQPIMAMSVFGWPIDKLPDEVGKRVIEGGRKVCEEVVFHWPVDFLLIHRSPSLAELKVGTSRAMVIKSPYYQIRKS